VVRLRSAAELEAQLLELERKEEALITTDGVQESDSDGLGRFLRDDHKVS
jgi:hypothetical protein